MLVPVKQAIAFVNSHTPIYADNVEGRTIVIHFEEVDLETGRVSWASEAIGIKDGCVDIEKVREILGY